MHHFFRIVWNFTLFSTYFLGNYQKKHQVRHHFFYCFFHNLFVFLNVFYCKTIWIFSEKRNKNQLSISCFSDYLRNLAQIVFFPVICFSRFSRTRPSGSLKNSIIYYPIINKNSFQKFYIHWFGLKIESFSPVKNLSLSCDVCPLCNTWIKKYNTSSFSGVHFHQSFEV